MSKMKKILFFAMAAALAACSPSPTPTIAPAPSPTQTIVPATATLVSPTAMIAPPTLTSTLSPTPVFSRIATVIFRNSDEPPPISITLILKPEPNAVTASFTARGDQSLVELNAPSSGAGIAQAAIIFEAFCNQPGITRFTLNNLVNGRSATMLNVPLATLLSGALNLDIKNSIRAGDGSLACASIPEAWFIKLEEGAQPGTVIAFAQAGGTEVDVFLKPGSPGTSQPAFIREGKCNDLGAIRYSLNPIVDGISKTFSSTRFIDFKKEKAALNVHKSVQDLETSVACGLLTPGDGEGKGR